MRTVLALSLAVVVAAVVTAVVTADNAQAAADVAVPLAPSGKWVIDGDTAGCTLAREFGGAPGGVVTAALTPTTLGDAVTLVMVAPKASGPKPKASAKARLTLAPSGAAIPVRYERVGETPDRRKVARMMFDRVELPALMAATAIRIEVGGVAVAIAPTAGAQALTALTACETALVRTWGVDPVAAAAAVTPPRGAPDIANWLRVEDYPQDALRRRSQGATIILWQVGLDGAVSGCRTVKSAGDPVLDTAACGAIAKRARYSPALDKDGRPVTSWVTRTVTWRMPGS